MQNKNKQYFLNNFKRCMDLQTDYTDGLSNKEKKSLINLFESCKVSYNEESISRYFSFKEYLSKHAISTHMSEKDILVVSQILSKEHLEFNEDNIIRAMRLNYLSMKLGLFFYPYKLRYIFHLVKDMTTNEISSLMFGVSKKVMLESGTAEDKNNREKIYGELKKYTYEQFTDVDKEILRLINLSKDYARGYYLNKGMKPHSTNELLVNLYENIKKRLSEESVELTSLTISEMEALRDFTRVYHTIAKHIDEGNQEKEYTQKDGSIIRKRRADKIIEDYAARFAKKTADRVNADNFKEALASLAKATEKFGESETFTSQEIGDMLENCNTLLDRLNYTKTSIVRTILQEYGNELNSQYADNPNFNGEINEAISKKIIKRCNSLLIKEPSAIYESTQFLLGNNLKTVNNTTKDRFKKFAKEYNEDFKKVFEDEVIGADFAYNIMGNIRVDNIKPHHHLKYMNTNASIYNLLSVKNVLTTTKFFVNNIYDAIAPKESEKVSFDKKIQYLTNNGYDVNTFLDGDNISTIYSSAYTNTTFKNAKDNNLIANIAILSKIIPGGDIQNIIKHNLKFMLQNTQTLNNSIMALVKDAGNNKELFREYLEMYINAIPPKSLKDENIVIDYKTLSKSYKCITTNNNVYINLTDVNMPEFEQTQEDNSNLPTPKDVNTDDVTPTEENPLDIEKELSSLQNYAINKNVAKNTVAEKLQDMGKDNFVSPIRAKIKFLKHLDKLLESLENYDDTSRLEEIKNDLAMKEMDLADQLFILDKASLSYFRREREGKIIKESKHNYKEVTQNEQDHSAYMQILSHLGLKPNPSDELYSTLTTKMELDKAETERLVREKETRKANERDFELIKLENTMLNELIEKLDGIIAQKSIKQAKDEVVSNEGQSTHTENVEGQEQVETNQKVEDNNTEDNNQENSSPQTQEKKQGKNIGKKQDNKPQVTLANKDARIAELSYKIKKQWNKLLVNRHYFQEENGKIITNWENSIRHSYFSKLLKRIKDDDKEYQDLTGESLYEALVRYFENNRSFRGSYENLTNETLGLSRDIND